MLLEWDDKCEDNSALCDNSRTTSEYEITYHAAGGGVVNKRQLPGPASQYTLDGVNANNNYEIKIMIVANGSNTYFQ